MRIIGCGDRSPKDDIDAALKPTGAVRTASRDKAPEELLGIVVPEELLDVIAEGVEDI